MPLLLIVPEELQRITVHLPLDGPPGHRPQCAEQMSRHPIIAVLLLTAAIAAFSCRQSSERPAERKAQVLAKVHARIAELSAKYNADAQWHKPFDNPDRLFFYTVELQRVLIGKDRRPLIFVATVDDLIGE